MADRFNPCLIQLGHSVSLPQAQRKLIGKYTLDLHLQISL